MPMKKLIIPLALALCCAPLAGRALGLNAYNYDDGDQYTPGGASLPEPVRSIDIGWISGSVTVRRHAENTVAFSETANCALTAETSLHYWLDDGTLRIRFAQDGANIARLEKQLVVCLPETLPLESLGLATTSAIICLDGVSAENASLSSTSGAIDVRSCAFPQSAAFNSTSGAIVALLNGPTDQIRLNSVSGRIDVFAGSAELLQVNSVSGKALLSAEAVGLMKINTTSGAVDVTLRGQTGSGEISSVSGKVALHLPEHAGCTVETGSISGRTKCDFDAQIIGRRYIIGSGAGLYKINTVSGGILIGK